MQTTLLQYAPASTDPDPLQVSTNGSILISASNPGGYSDQPSEDFVAVKSIVIDFGLTGTGGSDLTNDPDSITVIISSNGSTDWGVNRSGLRFTFTPPTGGSQIFPDAGLMFQFQHIRVDPTVGSVTMTINETASSPGDPANPIYPAQPQLSRNASQNIGKFPIDFNVGELIAHPVIVPQGGSPTLSWTGSPGADYTLKYLRDGQPVTVTEHANGEKLQPNDTYPNTQKGDPLLQLESNTDFYLIVKYVAGNQVATIERQRTVDVSQPLPIIHFTVNPSWLEASQFPAQIDLTWKIENAQPDAVSFDITPPDSDVYTDHGHHNTSISCPQQIRIRTFSKSGQPFSQVRAVGSASQLPTLANLPAALNVSILPNGKSALFSNLSSSNFTFSNKLVDVSSAHPADWAVITQLQAIPVTDAVFSNDGKKMVLSGIESVHVADISSTDPGSWIFASLPIPQKEWVESVVFCRHLLVVAAVCKSGHCLQIFEPSGGNNSWTLTRTYQHPVTGEITNPGDSVAITLDNHWLIWSYRDETMHGTAVINCSASSPAAWTAADAPALLTPAAGYSLTTSRDGQHLYAVTNYAPGNALIIFDISNPDPGQWYKVNTMNGALDLPGNVIETPNGQYLIIPNFNSSNVAIFNKDANFQWQLIKEVTLENLPSGSNDQPYGAALTHDGRYLIIANGSQTEILEFNPNLSAN